VRGAALNRKERKRDSIIYPRRHVFHDSPP
jgi:hypothetical protein